MSSINGIMNNAISSAQTWNAKDYQMLAGVPEEQRPQVMAQIQMQKESEVVNLITNLMKQMHESRMAVIRNIG